MAAPAADDASPDDQPHLAALRVVPGDSQLARTLRAFFDVERTRSILLPLLRQDGPVSLRALDWLVCNHAKKHNIVVRAQDGSWCNVHAAYRRTLSVYKRTQFDPFRRRDRHTFELDGQTWETTLGQVHFLHFCHVHGILRWAREHAAEIEASMNSFSQAHKARLRELRRLGVKHKRKPLSQPHGVACHVYRNDGGAVDRMLLLSAC